jgi:hypothetical protein
VLTQDCHNGKMSFGFAVLCPISCADRCAAFTYDSPAVTFTSRTRRCDVLSMRSPVFDGLGDTSRALHADPVAGRVDWVQKQKQRLSGSASFTQHAIRVDVVEGR